MVRAVDDFLRLMDRVGGRQANRDALIELETPGASDVAAFENDLKTLKRDLKPGILQMLGVKDSKAQVA